MSERLLPSVLTIGVVSLWIFLGVGTALEHRAIHAGELSPESSAPATPPSEWGERRKVQDLRRRVENLRSAVENVTRLERGLLVRRGLVDRDQDTLPTLETIGSLVNTISKYERSTGVELTEVSRLTLDAREPRGGPFVRFPARLRVRGAFDQIIRFIRRFESDPNVWALRSLHVEPDRSNSSRGNSDAALDAVLELELLLFDDAQAKAALPPIQVSLVPKNAPQVAAEVRGTVPLRRVEPEPYASTPDPFAIPR